MIWFSLKKLEDKLKKFELTERDGYNYLFAFAILAVISDYALSEATTASTVKWINRIQYYGSLIITIWGLSKSFRQNESGDNKEFLKRFLSLAWVIGVRIFLILIPIAILVFVGFYVANYMSDPTFELQADNAVSDYIVVLMTLTTEIIYFSLIIKSFNRVNAKN